MLTVLGAVVMAVRENMPSKWLQRAMANHFSGETLLGITPLPGDVFETSYQGVETSYPGIETSNPLKAPLWTHHSAPVPLTENQTSL